MIEALIAFAVLSFGLVGVVTLLATSKSSQFESVQRTRAVTLASSLVERIRINPSVASNYDTTARVRPLGEAPYLTTPTTNCADTSCNTPAELATYDLWRFEQELLGASTVDTTSGAVASGGLIRPRACIIFNPPNPALRPGTGNLEIIITWRGLVESTDSVVTGDTDCGSTDEDLYRRRIEVNTMVVDVLDLATKIPEPP